MDSIQVIIDSNLKADQLVVLFSKGFALLGISGAPC